MTLKRGIAAWAAAFLISQVLAVVVHGILLAADYKPFYGSLLRPMDGTSDWHIALLPLTHVFYVAGLVWLYPRAATNGTALERGLKVGLIGYVIGQLPQWVLWYAEQPWPDLLVFKQLALELISSLVIGAVIGLVVGAPSMPRAPQTI